MHLIEREQNMIDLLSNNSVNDQKFKILSLFKKLYIETKPDLVHNICIDILNMQNLSKGEKKSIDAGKAESPVIKIKSS